MSLSLSIDLELENQIQRALQSLHLEITDAKKIADSILKMSDFYIENPDSPTPWNEKWCLIAQIAYYLPLNSVRNKAVAHRAAESGFPFNDKNWVDYGSGLGAGSRHFVKSNIIACERSSIAQKYHQSFFTNTDIHFRTEKEIDSLKDFSVVFSYSLTEKDQIPNWAFNAESMIVTEPSTQEDGRKLLEFRQQLIDRGYDIWAPCPHQKACPLLSESPRDWCHDRVHFDQPEWFTNIEKHLPMKNQTLTFSYLVASKKRSPEKQQWRIVGDPLKEKGKTRQMLCRGPEREFLAWMHKQGDFQTYSRGEIIAPIADFAKVSNELRISKK